MIYIMIAVTIGLLISSIFSLLKADYLSSLLQLIPAGFLILASQFPHNFVIQSLGKTISPTPEPGLLKSTLAARQTWFYAKIAALLVAVCLLCRSLELNVEPADLPHPLTLFLYLTPLAMLFTLLMSAYYALKLVYIKLSGHDAVWSEDDTPT